MFVIKTLIELFDTCQLLNIVAGIRLLPEKIIFVGYESVMTKKRQKDILRFFELRKLNIPLEFVTVERYSYDSILTDLQKILDTNEDCCFDLTGGKELVLTAMGEISTMQKIPMVQFNPRSGRFIRVKHAEHIVEPSKKAISIREDVVLNGGEMFSPDGEKTQWELNEEFRKDIRLMWDISRKNCTKWNQFIIALESLDQYTLGMRSYNVFASLNGLSSEKQSILSDSYFFTKLSEAGLLEDFSFVDRKLKFRYKNEQIQRAMSKAGNILELYIYLLAHEISEEETGFYNDIGIGVMIDWDGFFYNGQKIETQNEIDVFLMRNMIPVFISCKNGEVHKEDLYELFSVAQRFGGDYAKKILITNYVSSGASSRRYILQRAKDMKIEVIDRVDKMSDEELKAILKKCM